MLPPKSLYLPIIFSNKISNFLQLYLHPIQLNLLSNLLVLRCNISLQLTPKTPSVY